MKVVGKQLFVNIVHYLAPRESTPNLSSPTSDMQMPSYSFIINSVLLSVTILIILYVYRISKKLKKIEEKCEKTEIKTSRTAVCPVCNNEIQEDWTVCPHCGVRLKWKPFVK